MTTLSPQTIMNGLSSGFSLALMAVGLSIVWRTGRFLHAAHAATYLIGAYVGLVYVRAHPGAIVFSAVSSIIAGGALGAAIELVVYRQLRQRGSSAAVKLLASLAVLGVVQNAAGLFWGSDILTASATKTHFIRILGASTTVFRVMTWGVVLSIAGLSWALLNRSRIGVLVKAVASEPDLANTQGINTSAVHLGTMAFVSALAGLSGFLNSYETALTPSVGMGVLLSTVTGVIVGGVGTVYGALVGVMVIGLLKHACGLLISGGWEDAPVFALLLVFLACKPYGIFGKAPAKVSI